MWCVWVNESTGGRCGSPAPIWRVATHSGPAVGVVIFHERAFEGNLVGCGLML